jgi:hypothetical protein
MLLHLFPLFRIQRTALAKNFFGNAHFADIVKQRPQPNFADLLPSQSHSVCYERRI